MIMKKSNYREMKNYSPKIQDPRLEQWVYEQTHRIMSELMYMWAENRTQSIPTRSQAELILIDRIEKGLIRYEETHTTPS